MNNSLAFPGIFKGAMETKSKIINKEMMLAAAHAIANIVNEKDLNPGTLLNLNRFYIACSFEC